MMQQKPTMLASARFQPSPSLRWRNDVGAESHYIAILESRNPEVQGMRMFGSFNADLCALADWLAHSNIKTAAMESRRIYWILFFEILEERGLEVKLVNPCHMKNVPGCKSDMVDFQ